MEDRLFRASINLLLFVMLLLLLFPAAQRQGEQEHEQDKDGDRGDRGTAYFAQVMSRSSCACVRFGCVGMTRTLRP